MRASNYLAITTIFFAAGYPPSAIYAGVYRCIGNDGHVSYQQIRCHQNSKPLTINHNQTGWSGLRDGERVLLDTYQKREAGLKRRKQSETPQTTGDNKACQDRKEQLDAVQAKLRRGYSIRESANLHQQRREHQSYLKHYCTG